MGRTSLLSVLRAIDRAGRSAAYNQRVAENRQRRAYERAVASQIREEKAMQREEKARYLAHRTMEAEEYNRSVANQLALLAGVLRHTLSVDDNIDFDSLLTSDDYPSFKPESEIAKPAPAPQRKVADFNIRPLNFFERLFRSGRFLRQTRAQEAQQVEYDAEYASATQRYRESEELRKQKLGDAQRAYERERESFLRQVTEKNAEITSFKSAYMRGDNEAIEAYCTLVLDRSEYPDDFPTEHSVTYDPASKTVEVRKQVPLASVIPTIAEYKFVRSSDTISQKPRSKADLRKLHTSVLCQIALRTIHELLEADQKGYVEVVRFAGYLHAADPVRGGTWNPVVVSLSMRRKEFQSIRLGEIDPTLSAVELGAALAKSLDGTVSLDKKKTE